MRPCAASTASPPRRCRSSPKSSSPARSRWPLSAPSRNPPSTGSSPLTLPPPPDPLSESTQYAMSRYLYLVRHGEQQDAEYGLPDGPLSPRGRRQAEAIAERLSGVPFTSAWHSPLERASETARIMKGRMPALDLQPTALLFDCYPSGPTPDMPRAFESFFGGVTEEEIEAGQAQMADATAEFLSPTAGDRHDLLITHNFVIGWFVREVLDAPN